MNKRLKFFVVSIAMTFLLVMPYVFSTASPAQAAEIRRSGVLNANETIDDDLVISGEQVRVDGTVNGLLLAGGTTVTLNGTVNGDALLFGRDVIVSDKAVITGNLFAGAQTVTVHGQVKGSILGGAGSMVTGSKVGRNIYFGGYNLETQPASSVDRGLYFGGYQAILNGSIARNLNASAGAVQLDGSVGGEMRVDVSSPGQAQPQLYWFGSYGSQLPPSIAPGLRIGPDAKIKGQLVYTSQTNQSSAIQAAPSGGIVYQTPAPRQTGQGGTVVVRTVSPVVNWMFARAREFFTLLVLGLLGVWLAPVIFNRANEIARAKPAESAGVGLAAIIVGYVAALMTAVFILAFGLFFTIITLGGLSQVIFGIGFSGLALVVTAFTLVVSFVSKLVVAYLVGDLILAGTAPAIQGRRYWAIVIGVFLYTLIRSIPFLGWLIGLIVTIIGVGALWLLYRSRQTPPVAVEVAAG